MGRDEDDPAYVGAPADDFNAPADHFDKYMAKIDARVTTHLDLHKVDVSAAEVPREKARALLRELMRQNRFLPPPTAADPLWGSGRFVSEQEKLTARSPAAAEFHAMLRKNGLLYDTDKGVQRIIDDLPHEAPQVEEPPRAPAALVDDLQPRTLLLSEMERISRNIAHAMGLLAGAWLAECPLPHAALRNAGLLNEYPRNNGGRAVQASEARIKAQVESANRRSFASFVDEAFKPMSTKYTKEDLLGDPKIMSSFKPRTEAFQRELQGEFVPYVGEASRHIRGHSVDLAVIDDPMPRTLAEERAERIAELARRIPLRKRDSSGDP